MSMIAPMAALLFASFLHHARSHGAVSKPSGRIYPPNKNCPWCMGEMKHGSNPYGTVNRNERLSSPCMGSQRGASTRSNWGPYSRFAGDFEKPTYAAGQTFEANVVLDADHGGDAQWQICPHSQAETEECFLKHRITGWKDVHCPFGRCDAGPHAFDRQSYTDKVTLPLNIPAGGATLRWLWVCKWTNEVFTSCIDVDIISSADSDGTNTVFENAVGVGGWGGSCTCPDGQVYQVGDNGDACGSLACIDGTPGTCNRKEGAWSNRQVNCAKDSPTPKPAPPPTPLPKPSPSPSPTDLSTTSLAPKTPNPASIGIATLDLKLHEAANKSGTKVMLSFSPVGSDKVRFEVQVNRLGWIGFGISTGTTGLMTGGGLGADAVVCSGGQVRRYWLMSYSGLNEEESSEDVDDASCTQVGESTTLVFTRGIAASNEMQRTLTPGTPQPVVVAWGDKSVNTASYHQGRQGMQEVDFGGDGSDGDDGTIFLSFACAQGVSRVFAFVMTLIVLALIGN